ncbi:MAG: flagellar basal body rod C-terminal domain-containing protein, partial [Roseinatronobacter sp.]
LGAARALTGGSGPAKPAALHAADTLSFLASERLAQDQRGAANTARAAALEDAFTARGVDTDAELSKLLTLEQAYAANAKVIATVDAMWRTLLENV